MDKDRIRRASERARHRSQAEFRRLGVYAFFIVLLGSIIFSSRYGGDDSEPSEELPYDFANEPAAAEPLARVDRQLLADVKDNTRAERAWLDPEPSEHLVREAGKLVFGDLETLGSQRLSWTELSAASTDHRGDAVWTLAELQWFEGVEGAWPPRWRGEVVDQEGLSWNWIAVTEPRELSSGDVVKVQGFFLKHLDMLRPDGSFSSGPLIIGEELLASTWRIDPVDELPVADLAAIRDYDLQAASRSLDEPALYKLLSYVDRTPFDELFDTDRSPDDYELRPVDLLRHSDAYRGKPVRVFGTLLHKQLFPLGPRGENPLGVPFAWWVWIDNQFGGLAVALVLEDPTHLQKGDIIYADGLFYRRWAFENALNRPVMSASIVAKRLVEHVPEKNTLTPVLIAIAASIVTLACALLILASWKDRAASARARTKRMQAHRRNVARPGRLHRNDAPVDGAAAPPPNA